MNARELALIVINDVNTNGAYANIALARVLNKHNLSGQDRRFVTELVYGTIKSSATLDWIISHYISRPVTKIAPIILDILRMGIYQIFFLSKVPVSAACNQSVELAKKYGHQGTVKFVNAVLRSAGRNPEKIIYPDRASNPSRYIALKYFHPQWIVDRWIDRWGIDNTELLCNINNQTPHLSIRTNTCKINREELFKVLTNEGVTCEASLWTPEGIICHEYPALNSLCSLQDGLYQVQDESSMLVAHVLAPQPGEFVIDACGAPGGKSTHIAALMNNTGRIVSTDIYQHKLSLTQENAARLGIDIIQTELVDAATLHESYKNSADRVLVDAPCSGLGVLRRKPDSRWRKNEKMLSDLPILQKAILASAAECIKKEGILVYSTCTTEPEENEQVITHFLNQRTDYILEKSSKYLPNSLQLKHDERDTIQLLPHIDNVDGFFIARMRRI